MSTKPHKSLECWIRGRAFVKTVYSVSASFPKEELYGIVSQMRRAAVSIVLNIAEGAARRAATGSNAEFRRFLNISVGSLAEVDTLILLCEDLNYISKNLSEQLQKELDDVGKPLYGLMKSLPL